MEWHWDTISVPTLVSAVAAVTGVAFFLKASFVKAQVDVLKQTGDGWKQLAEQRAAEIIELRVRVTTLEGDYKEVQKERTELLRLNLGLQRQVDELERKMDAFQQKRRIEDTGTK